MIEQRKAKEKERKYEKEKIGFAGIGRRFGSIDHVDGLWHGQR